MSRFLDPLVHEDVGTGPSGRPLYRLTRDFRYEFGAHNGFQPRVITVPAGFTTDLCSTPRFGWFLIPPTLGRWAGVVHDYLYRSGELPRNVSDAIFRHALKDRKVDPLRRWVMWAAVRMWAAKHFAGRHWQNR